jgi:hypothetical protein
MNSALECDTISFNESVIALDGDLSVPNGTTVVVSEQVVTISGSLEIVSGIKSFIYISLGREIFFKELIKLWNCDGFRSSFRSVEVRLPIQQFPTYRGELHIARKFVCN